MTEIFLGKGIVRYFECIMLNFVGLFQNIQLYTEYTIIEVKLY